MRTVKFREVLWGAAFKLGIDPTQGNFLTNQAVALGTFIDAWVRRVYPLRDWPEWVRTHEFQPVNHVVPWDSIAQDVMSKPIDDLPDFPTTVSIGRVLQVFLIDPTTANGSPVDTRFEEREDGVWVGFDHGTSVWIRYLPLAPRYTAAVWDAATTYAKGDPTYSYTTGECYLSKVDGNIGNDPAAGFTPPPPQIVQTQSWTPDNTGIVGQPQVLYMPFTDPDMGDPPPAGTFFSIVVLNSSGIAISTVTHTATGTEHLSAVISTIAGLLSTDLVPLGFIVTFDVTAKTITLSDNSDFSFDPLTIWTTPNGKVRYWKAFTISGYIPSAPAVAGQPQISRITLNAQTSVPNARYTLTLTDSRGAPHTVVYQSDITDSAPQILLGLAMGISAATDPYFLSVHSTFNPVGLTLDLTVFDNASVGVVSALEGSAFWDIEPFPKSIADQVMRGGYADLLKEWGQTDKGLAEEQQIQQETATASIPFTTTPNPPLSGQIGGQSRYKVP